MADSAMMAEKWTILYRLLDINKDGCVTSGDRDSCVGACAKEYGSVETISNDINVFWDCLVFPSGHVDWSAEIKVEDFIAAYSKCFTEDKEKTTGLVKLGVRHLLEVIDSDGDGKITFEKFFKFHIVFGLAHEAIVRTTFNLIGPDEDGICSRDRVRDYYEELFIGENKEQFAALKNAFRPFGMS